MVADLGIIKIDAAGRHARQGRRRVSQEDHARNHVPKIEVEGSPDRELRRTNRRARQDRELLDLSFLPPRRQQPRADASTRGLRLTGVNWCFARSEWPSKSICVFRRRAKRKSRRAESNRLSTTATRMACLFDESTQSDYILMSCSISYSEAMRTNVRKYSSSAGVRGSSRSKRRSRISMAAR